MRAKISGVCRSRILVACEVFISARSTAKSYPGFKDPTQISSIGNGRTPKSSSTSLHGVLVTLSLASLSAASLEMMSSPTIGAGTASRAMPSFTAMATCVKPRSDTLASRSTLRCTQSETARSRPGDEVKSTSPRCGVILGASIARSSRLLMSGDEQAKSRWSRRTRSKATRSRLRRLDSLASIPASSSNHLLDCGSRRGPRVAGA